MKIKLISLALFSALILAGSVQSVKADGCTLTNTGPGSNNTCSVNEDHNVSVNCVNGVDVQNVNSQSAESGTVKVNGNTVSGTATSGDSSNINTVANELSQSCLAATPVAVVPATVTTPAEVKTDTPAQTLSSVKALPKTGSNDLVTLMAGIGGFVVVAVAILQMRAGYLRRSLK